MKDTKVKQITHASCMISYASMTNQRDNGTKGVTKIYSYVAKYGNAITTCVGVTVFEKNIKLKPTCAASGICLVMLRVANSSPH